MRLSFGRKTMVGAIGTIVAVGIGLMVLAAAGIAGWEYTNSDQFCETMCHSVHPEEIVSHKTAAHAQVRCVECHMGRNSTLKLIAMKPTHFKELWGMIVGYERPVEYARLIEEGRLEAIEAPTPTPEAVLFSRILGSIGLVLGLITIGLIIFSVVT